MAKPFLKWAGGKAKLADRVLDLMPPKCTVYHEPFLGGGAVFFRMESEGRFEEGALLSDLNQELVNCWQQIKYDYEEVVSRLPERFDREHYESVREWELYGEEWELRAARFLYLNKTCFNGLYRVNKQGKFNVPWGKRMHVDFDVENLQACSRVLEKALILERDFAGSKVNKGDAVYFDPPYLPTSKTASFTAYTAGGFPLSEHERLAVYAKRCAAKGACVIVSNSNRPEIRDLYRGSEIHEVDVRRAINSKGGKRGPVKELLIKVRA